MRQASRRRAAKVFPEPGDEIRQTLELEATIAPIMLEDAHLQVSGMAFTFNQNRVPFNRVTSISIRELDGNARPIDPQALYRVVTDFWALEALETVNESAYGMVKIVPKDRTGVPVTSLEETILDADDEKPGIQEVKEWIALTEYIRNLPDLDGDSIPDMPARYEQPEGRINAISSWNPIDLLKGCNYITVAVLGILVLMLGLVGLLIWGIVLLGRRVVKPRSK